MAVAPSRFERTEAGLAAVAFLAPLSATRLILPVTLGRAAALTLAWLLLTDIVREKRLPILSKATVMLAGGLLCLSAWILLSTVAWGCSCDGKLGGFLEFAFIGLLALAVLNFEPRIRAMAMLALLAGIAFAAFLALIGVGAINSGTIDLTQTGGRLSGTFGNANELGFSAALGIPIALAYRGVAGRTSLVVSAIAILILGATILLTYSRGAVLATGAGVLFVLLWEARGSRRRIAIILGATAATALIAAVLYSVFQEERQEVSFRSVSPALKALGQVDATGWDSRAKGPITHGPSQLLARGHGFAIQAASPGEGASFRWGEARSSASYTLSFKARSERGTNKVAYALGDPVRPAALSAQAAVGSQWRNLRLRWHPGTDLPHATVFVWANRPGTLQIEDLHINSSSGQAIEVPEQLKGSLYTRISSGPQHSERRYISSRLDAARLALEAFASDPIQGIGWATFPDYAASHLSYGQLAVHNQYISFAAELGLIGVLLLALLIASVVIGVKSIPWGLPEVAAAGVMVSAAVGMFFDEALPTPQLSITLAIAAAVLCSPRWSGLPRDEPEPD